jgi:hypothetical protein
VGTVVPITYSSLCRVVQEEKEESMKFAVWKIRQSKDRSATLGTARGSGSVCSSSPKHVDTDECSNENGEVEVDDSFGVHFHSTSLLVSKPTSLGTGNFSCSGGSVCLDCSDGEDGVGLLRRAGDNGSSCAVHLQGDAGAEEQEERTTSCSNDDDKSQTMVTSTAAQSPPADNKLFARHSSSFLRVADLSMACQNVRQVVCHTSNIPNFHHSSISPPPGVIEDTDETWVALDDGNGRHAPIAPSAVQALAGAGVSIALDGTMWIADPKTTKLMGRGSVDDDSLRWSCSTFEHGPATLGTGDGSSEVLVWSGKCHHNFYGSEIPLVRAAAIINMSAADLLGLLLDSDRVKEYNAMSQGRTDLKVLQETLLVPDVNRPSAVTPGLFGGVTKITQSESRPPMIRRTLQFTSLLHGRHTPCGSYVLVSRAVSHSNAKPPMSGSVLISEILLGVNFIRPCLDHPDRCLLISVNHVRSPMVPMCWRNGLDCRLR